MFQTIWARRKLILSRSIDAAWLGAPEAYAALR